MKEDDLPSTVAINSHLYAMAGVQTRQIKSNWLLLGWALLEEESAAVRLAMRDAFHCTQSSANEGKLFLMHPGGKMISAIRSRNGCWQKLVSISCVSRYEAPIRQNAFTRVCHAYNAFCVAVIVTGPIFTPRCVTGLRYLPNALLSCLLH